MILPLLFQKMQQILKFPQTLPFCWWRFCIFIC